MSLFRRTPRSASPPYLFDGPHWRVGAVRDLTKVFAHLGHVVPDGATLCLAEAAWSDEGRKFVRSRGFAPEGSPLPSEFRSAPGFSVSAELLVLLTDLASRHAAPELGIHLGVFSSGFTLVEWYDLPDDPISVASSITEARVAAFAGECGVGYEAR